MLFVRLFSYKSDITSHLNNFDMLHTHSMRHHRTCQPHRLMYSAPPPKKKVSHFLITWKMMHRMPDIRAPLLRRRSRYRRRLYAMVLSIFLSVCLVTKTVRERESSFLTAHQHKTGHSVPPSSSSSSSSSRSRRGP